MERFDIGIMGGGISGLYTALKISENCNAKVVLIEKNNQLGSNGSSAGIYEPNLIKKLKLEKSILAEYDTLSWISTSGFAARFCFDEIISVAVDYKKMCDIIVKRIRKKGVKILTNTTVKDYENVNSGIILNINSGEKIKVNLLIDASGIGMLVAKKKKIIPKLYYSCLGYVFEGGDIDNTNEFSFLAGKSIGSGGWFYPITRSTFKFGITEISKEPILDNKRLESFIENAKKIPGLKQVFENTKKTIVEKGVIPIQPLPRFFFDRIMVVGDAAGQAPAIMGEGIRHCLLSADICGLTAVKAYQKNYSKSILKKYELEWKKMFQNKWALDLANTKIIFNRNDNEWDSAMKRMSRMPKELFMSFVRSEMKLPKNHEKPLSEVVKMVLNYGMIKTKWNLGLEFRPDVI